MKLNRTGYSKCKTTIKLVIIVCILFLTACKNAPTDNNIAQLKSEFQTPPDDAKPRVWWHWMNGNVTKEGIRADLEWMNRVGIGGFQNFDAGLNSPQVVENRLVYMTPDWKDHFLFTTKLADSLGLEMAIAGSPGWSESGGPWVKPEEAMKKYVWSEVRVKGGETFNGKLPQPPSVSGPFQNIGLAANPMGGHGADVPNFYSDVKVFAYRLPDADKSLKELNPKITSSGGNFTVELLSDGDLVKTAKLPESKISWIQYEFAEPVTMQAVTVVGGSGGGMFRGGGAKRTLEASNDGKTFTKVIDIPNGSVDESTLTFAPTTAKYFRAIWEKQPVRMDPAMAGLFGFGPPPANGTDVAEFVLHTGGRVNRFEDKAAFSGATDLYTVWTPEVAPETVVDKNNVVDLTAQMQEDGMLNWTPEDGEWMIVRMGYSLTGHQNSPASPEATGLEVDKLNAKHVKAYFTNYLDQYKDATGGLMGEHGLQYVITDSWEAGTQNWTDEMITEFENRRGYEMLPWMPVLTGHIVESAEASDRFLWDFRKTLADLVVENHYDLLTTMLKERNMGRYSESHEARRAFIGDGMEVKKTADVPMGAGWTPGGFGGNEGGFASVYQADIRESSSVAHLYGQKYVAAESLTAMGSDWAWSPELLKPIADHLMACGLNRFVIHTSVHQPLMDKAPGMSLGPFGQWFTRNETWAEQATAWTSYLARSCYMLQQGKYVADIVWYYGEDNNITTLFSRMRGGDLPAVPEGYSYDFINADAVQNWISVDNGEYVTPTGMSYRVLVLDPNSSYMTLALLKKIKSMVEAGGVVTGAKPIMTPSLSDDPAEFDVIVNQLWANENGVNTVGSGKVYAGFELKDVMTQQEITPDMVYTKPKADSELFFAHRQVDGTDIYWVNNRSDEATEMDVTFRVAGKIAEVWHPETGKTEAVSFAISGNQTTVPMHLEPNDAVFVVFGDNTNEKSVNIPKVAESKLEEVAGPWTVEFQPERGAPAQATFEALTPWNENADQGIKYFSGTASYKKTIATPESWLADGSEVWIDLGALQNMAEVKVNGKSMGIVWKKPFKVNITEGLTAGENELEIEVTNLWVNRQIGDQQPGVEEKITFVSNPFYKADSPLKTSGLMGPVSIISMKQ
ncbi:glycosyl hydrolase [uncultured Draconibacterium sp.]|uniref:glycosyl hydrolase n=1 Tax=uncultured Draconibacterium sp. TaxID=1573823 RepID=UPI002AA5F499|nr:glycosyl hydrolase [uncultured Draconibacterium sp.]